MCQQNPAYFTAFKNLAMSRTDSGVLTLRFHTDGGPATFTGATHTDFTAPCSRSGRTAGNKSGA
ncbi:hypothetical protein ACIQJT_37700 [Streptomyces sp. NPDC091972]|uniref:hypothetical protein n=1 Tax=Streptomyces sp. NPDC091972 TaxID=3366007 RepID=UPI0037F481BC